MLGLVRPLRSTLRYCGAHLFHTQRIFKQDVRWPGWEVVVGIEVHAQIKSRHKLFSNSLTSDPGQIPNTHVCEYDAAFPGTFPRLNPKCVDLAVRTAIALDSQIQHRSAFDRKHYFYSDLPAGYQITQQYAPMALGGRLRLPKERIVVNIKQIQLEQDTAKSTFDSVHRVSQIDLNRAGTGLMEIVSEPDIRSPEEAADYVRTLQAVLRSVGSSDGNMEQGSLRCDVNVSINRPGDPPGTRCEIKNLNSVKFMMIAIASEVFRQISLLESGSKVPQETRGFDEDKSETFKLRRKEDAPDYRYMPDPNLPPLLLTADYIDAIRTTMPELPDITRARLQAQGLSLRDTDVLMTVNAGREIGFDGEQPLSKGAVAYFDKLAEGRDPKVVVNWMTHELLGQLTLRKEEFGDNIVSVDQLGELIDLVQSGVVTGTSGKTILRHIITHRSTIRPSELAKDLSLLALSSAPSSELEQLCNEAIVALPEEAAVVRKCKGKGSKSNVINKIVGRVMKSSRGRADAKAVRDLLERMILGNQD